MLIGDISKIVRHGAVDGYALNEKTMQFNAYFACHSKAKAEVLSTFSQLLGTIAEHGKEILEEGGDEIPIAIRRGRGFVQQNFMRN